MVLITKQFFRPWPIAFTGVSLSQHEQERQDEGGKGKTKEGQSIQEISFRERSQPLFLAAEWNGTPCIFRRHGEPAPGGHTGSHHSTQHRTTLFFSLSPRGGAEASYHFLVKQLSLRRPQVAGGRARRWADALLSPDSQSAGMPQSVPDLRQDQFWEKKWLEGMCYANWANRQRNNFFPVRLRGLIEVQM